MGGSQSVEVPGGGTEGYHVLRYGVISAEQVAPLLMNVASLKYLKTLFYALVWQKSLNDI